MMEIIAVIVILGIITAVAIPRFTKTRTDDLAAANTLKAHLRYAQLRAMGDIVSWGIDIETDKYTLIRESGIVPNLPGENNPVKDNLEVSLSPQIIITFSAARGQPMDSNGDIVENNQIITVGSRTITITAETGFIE